MSEEEVQKFIKAVAKSIEVASEHQQKMIEIAENDENLSEKQRGALKFAASLLPYGVAMGWLKKIDEKKWEELKEINND